MKELDFAAIVQRIKEVRSSKKLTQEYLAEKTGVNVSHISNIEINKVKVSRTLLVGICNVRQSHCHFRMQYFCDTVSCPFPSTGCFCASLSLFRITVKRHVRCSQ